ncbi:hypothetical protein DQ04_02441060 [Trypanosoma grayi]|uniref:hypothetical protein n=1 Tax=Trypanosoma grayi TaxID=71804 RepID=UPI0004F487E5|nr:hypothetical protein DQ04_02441060 [Trypanosoma grayi]KEG11617.1 hypothetical protein DQ04_02441060 [Trypanosoma grayi]
MSSEGFRFSFAEDEPDVPPAGGTGPSSAEAVNVVSLLQLPIYTLTPQLLEEWMAQYPEKPQDRMKLLSTTSAEAAAWVQPLMYQRAPHVAELTAAGNDEQRDIIPGKYYGGLKVWSCAPYLVEYMFENRNMFARLFAGTAKPSSEEEEGARVQVADGFSDDPIVAEVGCGQGLPGIAALLLGARRVIFQDYNEEVLQLCVKPNIAVNMLLHAKESVLCHHHHHQQEQEQRCPPVVQMVSGDWSSLRWQGEEDGPATAAREVRCRVVLGSDVTFDEEACEKLADMLGRCLCPLGGVAYIATKQYYFGTNGGALEFQKRAERRGLEVSEVSRADAVGGMQRLIMRVRHPDQMTAT